MINNDIRKIIIRNLSVGGIIIALATGGVVSLIEHNRFDEYLSNLALNESNKFSNYYQNYYEDPSPLSLEVLSNRIQNDLDINLFIIIEVYDNNLNKIIDKSINEFEIQDVLNYRFSSFKMKGELAHIKTSINEQWYVKTMSPIRDKKNSRIIGHFEGVYRVSEEKIRELKKHIFLSVVQSVGIVLITTFLLYPVILNLDKKLKLRTQELLDSNVNTLKALGNAIAKRDTITNAHNYRVTIYSVRLAEQLKISRCQIQSLIKGAFLHDVGKIGISDTILLKKDTLTPSEIETMKQHVVFGVDILKKNKWLEGATDVVLYHHEKYNGSGYVSGLEGKNIPLNARIFAIADVFDALTSERPYKKAFSFDESIGILRQGAGSHFEPDLILIFETIAKEVFMEISELESEQKLNTYLNSIISQYFIVS